MLLKDYRPYAMVIVKIKNNQFAIPFRHNINRHEHSYFYPTIEAPDKDGILRQGGLDYTKAIIIKSEDIWKHATIDTKEFNLIKSKDKVIAHQFELFINEYLNIIVRKSNNTNHPRDYFILKTSTLQYYHLELGIN